MMFFYFPYVLNALQVIPWFCTDLQGSRPENFLSVDYSQSCKWELGEYQALVYVSCFVLFVYGVGFPVYLLMALKWSVKAHKDLAGKEARASFEYDQHWSHCKIRQEPLSFLYSFLKPSCYWWVTPPPRTSSQSYAPPPKAVRR